MAQRLEAVRPNRIPPHNLDAEQSVLGAMLESKEAIANVVDILHDASDFYKPAHSEIYDTIMALYGRGEAVDAITAADELARRGKLEQIGGKPYIHGLLEAYPTAASAGHYARIVEELALLRRLIEAGGYVQELGFSMPEDVADALNDAEEAIFNVGDKRLKDDYHEIRKLLMQSMKDIEKLYERGANLTGLSSGFPDLDDMTAGFQPSNLIIVAARPSMGKSSIMNDFVLNVSLKQKVPTVIFSLEMSKEEVVKRFLSSEAKVDAQRINKGALQETDWTRLSSALGRLGDAPIFVDDSANISLMEMRAKCRRLKAKHGLGMIVIDYLQLMQSPRKSENRQQEVTEISRNLKILARELKVPVVCASQLNRGVEMRSDKRPLLGDLRESGCLTADTRITRADTGAEVTIGELYRSGERDIPVWTMDENYKMVRGTMTHAFSSGVKKVYRLKLRSGREVKASANHPFFSFDGWKRLDQLWPGERLAIPRSLPTPSSVTEWSDDQVILLAHLIGDGSFLKGQPLRYATKSEENRDAVLAAGRFFGITGRWKWEEAARSYQVLLPSPHPCARGKRNPVNEWLEGMGLFNKRSHEKFIPALVFSLPDRQAALFLRHLWATDGHVGFKPTRDRRSPSIYYASSSRELVEGVARLLQRFEVVAQLGQTRKSGYRNMHQAHVRTSAMERFLTRVGAFGPKLVGSKAVHEFMTERPRAVYLDSIPEDIWQEVLVQTAQQQVSLRSLRERTSIDFRPGYYSYRPPTRQTVLEIGRELESELMLSLAQSDLYWDEVVSVECIGKEEVFDATVLDHHNLLANGIICHNSIEQDADVVMFIYRDEVYNPDTEFKGEAELIIAKHRNGPTGKVRLAFMNQYTKFASIAKAPL